MDKKYYINVNTLMENQLKDDKPPRLLTGDATYLTRVVIDTCQEQIQNFTIVNVGVPGDQGYIINQ